MAQPSGTSAPATAAAVARSGRVRNAAALRPAERRIAGVLLVLLVVHDRQDPSCTRPRIGRDTSAGA
eukprot:3669025-Prymnesium_polylepis.2